MKTLIKTILDTLFTMAFLMVGSSVMAQEIESKIDSIFLSYANNESVKNAFVEIESESVNLNKSYGAFLDGELVDAATPFYTASIGKVFTATAIALLYEEGKLDFKERISTYLSDDLIDGLHVLEGNEYASRITITQLLSHTSGLADLFEDKPHTGVNMMEMLFQQPQKYWEPKELVDYMKTRFNPISAPGKSFHYSDTGFIVLGLIVEKVSGKNLHQFFLERIFDPLQLNATYLNLRSANHGRMAEMFAGSMELSGMRSLSADWAGGGIVSTSKDLNTLLGALFEDEFLEKETLTRMMEWIPESQGTYYGFGIRKWKLKELNPSLPDLSLWGHSGSNATFMYYCPELKVKISGTFNQFDAKRESVLFMIDTLVAIQNSK